MFCGGNHIAKGRIHDNHAVFARRIAVHIVNANTASDNLEIASRI